MIRLALVMESDTVRSHLQTGQPRQAVVDAFRNAIGNVVRIGIVAPILQRQNSDGIASAAVFFYLKGSKAGIAVGVSDYRNNASCPLRPSGGAQGSISLVARCKIGPRLFPKT
jgi:hypothetical protein